MPRASQNLEDSLEGKRESNTHRIYRWRLEASTDGENFFDAVSSAESDLSWK